MSRQLHESPRYDAHDHCRKEFLADSVTGLAVESVEFQENFLVSVVALDFPSTEIEGDDLVASKPLSIVEIGQKDGHGSIRGRQPYYSELDGLDALSVCWRYFAQVVAAWCNPECSLALAALQKCLHGGERGLSLTPKDEKTVKLFQKISDKLEARIAPIEKKYTPSRDKRQQLFGFFSLRRIDGDHGPHYGKTSEDIIRRGDKAHGKMAFPGVLEPAFRIKLVPDFLGGRERVFGTVYGEDAHSMPEKPGFLGPQLIGEKDGAVENVPKNLPSDFPPRLGESAAVDRFRSGPQPVSSGLSKELTRFHIHPLALSTPGDGENEGDELWEREFSFSGEVFRSALLGWVDLMRNNLQKFLCQSGKLA